MNDDGGRGGFNQGRGYQGRNFNLAYASRCAGRGRFPSGGSGGGSGPGGGRFNSNNNISGFFQGESSGTVGNRENDFGGGDFQENRAGNSANFHRGSNSNNNFRNSSGYAGNQSGRQYNGNNNLRSSGYNGRFADGRNAFNGNNGSANYNRSSGSTGANIRVSSEVDDAFLQKTVTAVVAAVTATQKPPEYVAQHGSVVRGDVSTANTGSEPSGAVPQGGDLPTEHVVQPVAPQTQAQEKAPVADDDDGSDGANKDKEEDNDGRANEMEMDGANEHTDKEASNTMEINENEGHKGKQAAMDRSSMEFKFGTFVSQVKLSDLDTILVLPKCFAGDAVRGSEMSDVAQEERLHPLSIAMGQTGSDKAETESSAAMCPSMLMATPAPSSPMTAAETVTCMGAEEESLHILPKPTSSLHVTRDKINGAGHVLRAEEIKQTRQPTMPTAHVSNASAKQEASFAKSREDDIAINTDIHSGFTAATGSKKKSIDERDTERPS
ncbi:hypothetical protein ACQ4PT_065931 [Festuca glaucescens]